MKKILWIIVLVFFVSACGSPRKINRTVEYANTDILYGKVNTKAFQMPQFSSWYNAEYKAYNPDPVFVDELKTYKDKISELVIILATWCPDTRRELPRVMKILDQAGFSQKKMSMYAVDRNKENDVKALDKYEFTHVPAIIFFDEEKEIARITEQPEMTLEEDLTAMLRLYYEN